MISYSTISEAWFYSCREAVENGREYRIDRGSYTGTKRRQLDYLAFIITAPQIRPLGINFSGEQISSDAEIERYFNDYLINPSVCENETYTYSSRLAPNLEHVALMLREAPNTNQATIEIGRPEDCFLDDPPCLRLVSWKAIGRRLQLSCFFRSWDLYGGLPTNLGGLQLLNETMAEWADLKPGPLVAYSDGGHVYDYAWPRVSLSGCCG